MFYKTDFDISAKLWRGPNILPLYNPNITIGQAVLDVAEVNATKVCQISHDDGYRMTYGEMRQHVVRVALNLSAIGMEKGDIICIVAKNSRYVAATVFGSFLVGLSVNTMDPFFSVSEMEHALGTTKPKLVLCDVNNLATVQQAVQHSGLTARIYTYDDETSISELLKPNSGEEAFTYPNLGDISQLPAVILCSSGTTGLPKSVCISHMALLYQLRRQWDLTPDDINLSFSSLYWMSGWIVMFATMLNGVARVITCQQFEPDLMLHIIEKYQVTTLFSAPYQMMLMTESAKAQHTCLKSLRVVQVGGSMVNEDLKAKLRALLPKDAFSVAYGTTEVGGYISSNYGWDRNGSVGKLTYGLAVKIIDEDGQRLGVGEPGEICIKTVYPFLGYKNNEEATRAAADQEGFLLTGDLGYFDADGYLFLVDRIKEIIKYRNHQISPSEIEAVIAQIPEVLSVSVVGIPDLTSTDLPAALIVRKSHTLTEAAVIAFVTSRVSDAKRLRGGVYFVDKLPLTYSGKVMRREVKRLAIELFNATAKAN